MIGPGRNIAIKVPLHRWDEMVAFYRDRIGLRVARQMRDSIGFDFNGFTLWLDRVPHQAQADLWLKCSATIRTPPWRDLAARCATNSNRWKG